MKRGFSLLEVLFALAVLAIAATALGQVLVSNLVAQHNITESARARAVAERQFERVVAELNSLPLADAGDFWSRDYPDQTDAWRAGNQRIGHTDYRYWITASTVNDDGGGRLGGSSAANGLKMVRVTVSWNSDGDAARSGRGTMKIYSTRLVNREMR